MADRVGFRYGSGKTIILHQTPVADEVDDIIDRIAENSHFWSDGPTLELADVIGITLEEGIIKNVPLPPTIHRNVALLHAEEWLHGLQHLRGVPIAGFTDREIDVAAYIHGKDIPLTNNFLRKYGRGEHQFLKENPGVV